MMRAMIAQLRGIIAFLGHGFVILDVSGVGYKIFTVTNTLEKMREGDDFYFWTHLAVRENAMELYGFDSQKELSFFEMLIGVSGIGPKSGLAILNLAPAESLMRAIAGGDTTYLTKVSGIGKKSAGKIIVELKDKLKEGGESGNEIIGEEAEVLDALRSLGYSTAQAREAIKDLEESSLIENIQHPKGVNEKIKEALRYLS